jgi:hypothetical protein
MGGTCGTRGREANMYRFWWERQRERGHLEDQGVDGSMGSKWILGRLLGGCGVDSPGSG